MNTMEQVATAFTDLTQQPCAGVWFAPGRVNLIGEHTDYNDGYVMPFAITQGATLAAGPRTDDSVQITSIDMDETHVIEAGDLSPGSGGWQAYLAGVVWAMREAGHRVGGVDLTLASNVPIGAGLSSSAAIECAVVAALCDIFELDIEPIERAKLARVAENAYVGAPTGLLDQAASTLCEADAALFLDCRTFDSRQVPLPLGQHALEILVLDTNTPHSHVDGEYAERRASCDRAAELLGVQALRDVTDLDEALEALSDEVMKRRVRHVVTENERVLHAIEVAESGNLEELAPLLDASHASMRDDFEITVETVDLAVETARAAGALGARMTGGGFGGCIIALCRAGSADGIGQHVAAAFEQKGFGAPDWFVATPQQGAHRLA